MQLCPDEFTYSTLIDGYVKQHDLNNALRLFKEMVSKKCKPNIVTYTSLIDGYCRQGNTCRAENLFREMQSHGLVPNVITYSILIGGFCKGSKLAKAASIFEEMLMNKCVPNDVTFNYLVNGFTNNASNMTSEREIGTEKHEYPVFLKLFKRMISDGLSSKKSVYNCIFICLCQHRMLTTAFKLREKMISRYILDDPFTFVALLHGICLEGKSREWKDVISCNLSEQDIDIAVRYSKLLDMYLPDGISSDASFILHRLVDDFKIKDHEANRLKVSMS